MNDIERYQFDLNGYLLVRDLLNPTLVEAYLSAANDLESHIAANIDAEPQLTGFANVKYRFDVDYQCYSYKHTSGGGLQYIVDDFLNASAVFDSLVNHEQTMLYVEDLAAGPYRIGASELRYRYKSNVTHTHMGGHMDSRNRYEFVGRQMYDSAKSANSHRDFDLLSVRVLYALHDIPVENGPLCVVPGSHKANFFSPFSDLEPATEPGMIPLPMNAGDAIIFTENLRHGGFPNLLDSARKTIHLQISPIWAASQSPIHWNDRVHVSEKAWARYSDEQRALLPMPEGAMATELKSLRTEAARLAEENARLRQKIAESQAPTVTQPAKPARSMLSSLRRAIGR
jgi:hypothetical protein